MLESHNARAMAAAFLPEKAIAMPTYLTESTLADMSVKQRALMIRRHANVLRELEAQIKQLHWLKDDQDEKFVRVLFDRVQTIQQSLSISGKHSIGLTQREI